MHVQYATRLPCLFVGLRVGAERIVEEQFFYDPAQLNLQGFIHTNSLQEPGLSTYLIAQLDIHDRATYTKYASAFMEIFNRYGGKLLSVEEAPEVLEGEWGFTRTVLLEFPSQGRAREWYESADYQAIAQHRRAASVANVVLIRAR